MRRRSVVLAVVLMVLWAVPAGGAIDVPQTDAPLPGSDFQLGDGDQDRTATLGDWDTLQDDADRVVVHASDDNEDSAFGKGSKEENPDGWELVDRDVGGKVDVSDAWGTIDQPADRTFLYLAFLRASGQGTTSVRFELNRRADLWENSKGSRIPCRTDGDVVISFDTQGNRDTVNVEKWTTSPKDNTSRSGCAKTGNFSDATSLVANRDVQGAFNDGAITNHLPGGGDTIADREFGETGIDLAKVLNDSFGDSCLAYGSVWLHSRASSQSDNSAMKDYLAPHPIHLHTCSASGTKYFDRNANGERDRGEPGLPRFTIFADYNGDGRRDADEPFAVTGRRGRYVIDDIRPGAVYTLREEPRNGRAWRCSDPPPVAAGPFGCGYRIDSGEVPYATGMDFGDWFPAQLTVRKRLYPAGDTGLFDLLVDGVPVLSNAPRDGARTTVSLEPPVFALPPGPYTVSEQAVSPTNPAAYRSRTECKRSWRRGGVQPGTSFGPMRIYAGARVTCTFRNVRRGAPAIAIDKVGPGTAPAGSTLHYTFYVENVGDVPIRRANVSVHDDVCDDAPAGPETDDDVLDPGDIWTYRCSHKTADPGRKCVERTVINTADVTGEANGQTTTDTSPEVPTFLTCPKPPGPPPPGPGPGPAPPSGGSVAPPGPVPPAAGVAGKASVARLRGCLRRGSVVTVRGSRIASIRVAVGGKRVRGLSVRPLQSRARVRLTRNFAPGRYRVKARIVFQRGSGTSPVTLRRSVRICGRVAPRVTG